MNSYQKHLVFFGQSRFRTARVRLRRQANEIESFDGLFDYSEHDLSPSFFASFGERVREGTRGFGYWSWKPQVILQGLREIAEGDALLYLDLGSHLVARGKQSLSTYFEEARQSESGILAFQAPSLRNPIYKITDSSRLMLERQWSKGDLLNHFGVQNDPRITETPQIGAGAIFVIKTDQTVDFFQRWLGVFEHDFSLADDSPSRVRNLAGFQEHRHDQSIFSILAKMTSISTRPWSEVDPLTEFYRQPLSRLRVFRWDDSSKHPIQHRRDLGRD